MRLGGSEAGWDTKIYSLVTGCRRRVSCLKNELWAHPELNDIEEAIPGLLFEIGDLAE